VGSVDEVMAKFADPEVRAQMRAELPMLEIPLSPIANWVMLRSPSPEIAKYDEQPLSAVAEALGYADPFEAFMEINLADRLMTKWYFVIGGGGQANDEIVGNSIAVHKRMAEDPYMIPGISDGGAHTKYSTTGHYGTLYLMTYVREHGWHSLEEAHWRLSALPAFAAGFKDRGTLVEGAPADIVIYDLEALDITDRETAYDYPGNEWRVIDRPVGYHYILVNGQVTMDHDVQTDVPSGRLLRNGRARALTLA
jgi:N-acyl-D-aspartate/D-glutamate deacylase